MRGKMLGKSRARKRTVSKKQLRLPFEAPSEAELLAKKLRLLEPAVWQSYVTRGGRVERLILNAAQKLMKQSARLSDLTIRERAALATLEELQSRGRPDFFIDRRLVSGAEADRLLYMRKLQALQKGGK